MNKFYIANAIKYISFIILVGYVVHETKSGWWLLFLAFSPSVKYLANNK